MKTLVFTFNLNVKDYSGMPQYYNMFSEEFNGDDFVYVNINVNPDFETNRQNETLHESNIYHVYESRFFDKHSILLEKTIKEVVEKEKVDRIILADYFCEPYVKNLDLKNIEVVLFIHLLYRGFADRVTKEPYYEKYIAPGVEEIMTKAYVEFNAINLADTLICNSNFTHQDLLRHYWNCGLESKKIIVAPLGVQKEKIPVQPSDSGKVAYFGRLTAMKGLLWLVDDLYRNKEYWKKNPLTVMGGGDMDLQFFHLEKFDGGMVNWLGNLPHEEMYEALEDIQYCIFPSIYEPYGLALNEALAMGKICLVAYEDTGMIEQIVEEDGSIQCAHVFDFKTKPLSECIQGLQKEPKEVHKIMSHKAIEKARDIKEHFKILRRELCH